MSDALLLETGGVDALLLETGGSDELLLEVLPISGVLAGAMGGLTATMVGTVYSPVAGTMVGNMGGLTGTMVGTVYTSPGPPGIWSASFDGRHWRGDLQP